MPLLGIYPPTVSEVDPRDRLRIVKEAGFDFVCLGIGRFREGEPAAISPAMCEEAGLSCDNVHLTCNGAQAIWAEGEPGEAIIQRMCEEIRLATRWGIHTGIAHVTWGRSTPPPYGEVGVRRFEELTRVAEENRFTLAIENSVYLNYLHPTLAHLDSPYVGFCFDCGHHHAFAGGEDLLGRYGDRLCATHIHDNDGTRDMHLMAFDGTADFGYITRGLAGTAFGLSRITSEAKGSHKEKFPGKTADEIGELLEGLAIMKQPGLVRIEDEVAYFYPDMSYEAMIHRQYQALRRVSDGILSAAGR